MARKDNTILSSKHVQKMMLDAGRRCMEEAVQEIKLFALLQKCGKLQYTRDDGGLKWTVNSDKK